MSRDQLFMIKISWAYSYTFECNVKKLVILLLKKTSTTDPPCDVNEKSQVGDRLQSESETFRIKNRTKNREDPLGSYIT